MSTMMRRAMTCGVLFVFCLVGCAGSKDKAAVQRAWTELNKLQEKLDVESGKAAAYDQFCDEVAALDVSDCPKDFQDAHVRLVQAYRGQQNPKDRIQSLKEVKVATEEMKAALVAHYNAYAKYAGRPQAKGI